MAATSDSSIPPPLRRAGPTAMLQHMRKGLLLLLMTAAAGATGAAAQHDAALRSAITAKIADTRARLAAVPDTQGLRQGCEGLLSAAERATAEGRALIALANLRRCLPYTAALEIAAARKPKTDGDLDAFRQTWKDARPELDARRQALGADPGAGSPLAVRAMIESELATLEPYYTSALLYGENTTIESGLLYLGMPFGIADFAAFAASLPMTPAAGAPPLPDLGGALFALDGDLLDFYKAQTTPEARSALIGTNSIFKLAQDLQTGGSRAGTLFEYLRAVESFAANRAQANEPPDTPTLRARLAAYAPVGAAADHSIAAYFVERLKGLLASDDANVDQRRMATGILESVLPAYDRVIAGTVPAAAAPMAPSGRPVAVTLVRWPYT